MALVRGGIAEERGLAAARAACEKGGNDRSLDRKRYHPACARAKSPSNCRKSSTPSLYFIGRIRTPWKRREDCPKNPRETRRRLHHRARSALGARPAGPRNRQPRRRALLDGPGAARSRAAGAASLSASAAARLRCARRCGPTRSRFRSRGCVRIEGNELSVVGLDCLDGTPLLDLKPYFASTDSVPDASVGWHAATKR